MCGSSVQWKDRSRILSDIVVKAEGLCKSYRIGHQAQRERYTALRDVMASGVRRALGRTRRLLRGELDFASEEVEEFWALRDVSFEVKQGEVLGIIGRNGAGKSTLLKVLSRITEPTAGRVTLRGRVASLLEVGTGFHPELTGRENIFLNGAILGMTRAEIKRKFDEIVAFAEVEKFLDTPVKRYSSGMYVRLAFAVAAHLEPEILVVDEVLAVGDAEFQKKCLGKMQDVSRGGRTVLFVSHNMAAIQSLCPRALCLEKGAIWTDTRAADSIRQYLRNERHSEGLKDAVVIHRSAYIEITDVVLRANGHVTRTVHSGDAVTIELSYQLLDREAAGRLLDVSLILFGDGQKLVNLWTSCTQRPMRLAESGVIRCALARWPFRNQQFRVDVYAHDLSGVQVWLESCLVFESCDSDFFSSGVITNPDQGIMFLDHIWECHASK